MIGRGEGVAVLDKTGKSPIRETYSFPDNDHACRYPEMPERYLSELVLSDESWTRIEPHIIGDGKGRGAAGRDNRMFVEGVLWVVRTGSAWRDMPEIFGRWNTVFRRFSRWSRKGIWDGIFAATANDPDFEYRIVGGTIEYVGGRAIDTKSKILRVTYGTRSR